MNRRSFFKRIGMTAGAAATVGISGKDFAKAFGRTDINPPWYNGKGNPPKKLKVEVPCLYVNTANGEMWVMREHRGWERLEHLRSVATG
jgi:hypothetical protein